MKLKYLILCFFYFVFNSFCENKRSPIHNPIVAIKIDSVVQVKSNPIFWKKICNDSTFVMLFDCNNLDCYQIELLNDPFKDLVILSVYFQDSLTADIYYNRFSFSTLKSNEKSNKHKLNIPIDNVLIKDTLYCYYSKEKRIKIKNNKEINIFFNNLIWNMPSDDEQSPAFDGETWKLKGRLKGKQIILNRDAFRDSVYYTNIQKLLDICKIKDYKYKKR